MSGQRHISARRIVNEGERKSYWSEFRADDVRRKLTEVLALEERSVLLLHPLRQPAFKRSILFAGLTKGLNDHQCSLALSQEWALQQGN